MWLSCLKNGFLILLKWGLDFRYQHFQKVCNQNQISALLIAHHADDQVCPASFWLVCLITDCSFFFFLPGRMP